MRELSGGIAASLLSSLLFVKLCAQSREGNDSSKAFKAFAVSFLVYLIIDVPSVLLFEKVFSAADTAGMVIFVNIMFLVSFTDIRNRIIPNTAVLCMLAVRLVTALISGISCGNLKLRLMTSAAGAVCGLAVTGITSVISKNGLGAGDVKMYAAIGAFAGAAGVIDILIYTALLCSVSGLVLLALKKCSSRSFIPMAPFACAGTVIYLVAGCAGI